MYLSPVKWMDLKNRLDTIPKIVLAGCFFLGSILLLIFYPNHIEERYGFSTSTPELSFFPRHVEVLMISRTEPGGAFSKAGFNKGDIILKPEYHTVGAFRKALDKPKGTVIEFETISREKYNPDIEQINTTIKRVIAP